MNQWRSPTAETVYRHHPHLAVRSAGTSKKARQKVSHLDIEWADLIFIMETKHRNRLKLNFNKLLADKTLHTLYIEDIYQYMDPELVELIKTSVEPILAEHIRK